MGRTTPENGTKILRTPTRQHDMGVTPRGIPEDGRGEWGSTLAIVVSRSPTTWRKEEKEETDKREDEAQIKENPEREITMIHSAEVHPVLNGIRPIYKQLGKADTNYEIRSRHEQFLMHIDGELYVPQNDKAGNTRVH